jgi:AcrR family transcriptional regulator
LSDVSSFDPAEPSFDRPPGYLALLRAVPRSVAKAGFRGLTYRALAREAGVTYGLVSYYFASRDELIHEAARLTTTENIANARLRASEGGLDAFAEGFSKVAADDRDAHVFSLELLCEALRSDALIELVRESYETYWAAAAEALRAAGLSDDPALTRLVLAALDGLLLQQLLFEDPAASEESLAVLRQMLRAELDASP